jgi:hypothetical protein
MYETNDLFRATALICVSGRKPDEYRCDDTAGLRPIVYIVWDNAEELPIQELETNALKVDPLEFKKVFNRLKSKIFEIIDGRYKDGNEQ